MEERFSGVEDTREETDSSVKENAKSNEFLTQNFQENWDTMKRPKLRKRNRRRRSTPPQRHRKYTQQNHRRKLSQPKERYTYEDTSSL